MRKKSLFAGLAAYILWGVLPLYWHALSNADPLVILCNRIVWSAVFGLLVLCISHKLPLLKAAFTDRRVMRYLAPSALIIGFNWGFYIWAINSGHVLDSSLGYYMNPLVSFALGLLLFSERCAISDYIAVGVAVVGVAVSTVSFGAFPYIALTLAVSFAVYGAIHKRAHVDAIVGITLETVLLSPIAIAFVALSPAGHAALAALDLGTGLLFLLAGPVTAIPLMLFAQGVNDLPLSTMGFLQFVQPTIMALVGVFLLGEAFTADRAVVFAFILLALVIYTVGLVRRERRAHAGG